MAHITGSIRIEAPPERVFDTVADSRLEPSFNPAMTTVELLTPEPIGLGTRFRARMANAGMDPWLGGPDEMGALLRSESARYAKIIQSAGIKKDAL